MLASPLRLKQRARFAELLDSIARQPADHDDQRFNAKCTRAAGVFGLLEIDTILLIFTHLLPATATTANTTAAAVGDRASSAPPARLAVLGALRDVQHFAQACKLVAAALHAHGVAVRIEAAAMWCTPLAPATTTRDAFGQLLQEEKSRFDVRVLEAALKCMAVHCAGDHCRAARQVCNARRAPPPTSEAVPARPPSSSSSFPRLAPQRPRVRVVMSAGRGHLALAAHPDRNECVLAGQVDDGKAIRITCYQAAPPTTLDPFSGLRRAWSASTEAAAAAADAPRWQVQSMSASACGQWVALTRVSRLDAHSDDIGCVVDLWRVPAAADAPPARPHAQLALRRGRDLALSVWFRSQDLASFDALDGVARRRAIVLCLCIHTFTDEGLGWYDQYAQWFPRASPPGVNRIFQFALEDGAFARACTRTGAPLPDDEGLLLRPQGVEVETVPEHHVESTTGLDVASIPAAGADFCRRDGATMPVAQSFAPETCISNTSKRAECPDSIGVCLRGAVTVPASSSGADDGAVDDAGVAVCAVAQCVILDLSYRHRNAGSCDALLQPVMPMRSLARHRPPMPETVHLSPRGDLAVVMVRHVPSTGHAPFYVLHVVGRRGASARFVPLACLDLNRCIHNFLTQRALLTPLLPAAGVAATASSLRPHGRVQLCEPARTCALSPCGRFLLMGFDRRAVRGSGAHGADAGVCVVDLSDFWDVGAARGAAAASAAVAWIDCKAEVLPVRMRWSRAGIWIDTRRGTLLLDGAGASPGAAGRAPPGAAGRA